MSHLSNLIKKELKELLTPSAVIGIVMVAAVFASIGGLIGSETEKIYEPSVIGVLNLDDVPTGYYDHSDAAIGYIDEFYTYLYGKPSAGYVKEFTDPSPYLSTFSGGPPDASAVTAAMDDLGVSVLLVFSEDYSKNIGDIAAGTGEVTGAIHVYWKEVDTGVFGTVSSMVIEAMISDINTKTAESIIKSSPMFPNSGSVQSPVDLQQNYTVFNGKVYAHTPSQITGALQSQSLLMPILIMIIIVMIGSMIISSMGNEKENKTLETLLTMPVRRTTIVAGKLIGSALAGLVFGLVYMVGMYFYTSSVSGSGTISMESLGLTLSITDWAMVAAMIFLAIMSALGMCMIIGAFVRNYKAAQTLTLPISVLAMIPMFVTMFLDLNTLPAAAQIALFAIPFTHPMTVMNNLMLGSTFTVMAGLAYLAAFALVMIYITVRIYRSDILLTGLIRKKGGGNPLLSLIKRTRQ